MKKIINFYKECYNEDRNRKFIQNIYSKDIELKYFIDEKEELLTNFLPYYFLEDDYAKKLKSRSFLYRKEKEILYCSIFLVGNHYSETGDLNKICAPLIFQNVTVIENNDQSQFELEENSIQFNSRVIESIAIDDDEIEPCNHGISKILSKNTITDSDVIQIGSLIEKVNASVDTTELIKYPDLINEKSLQKEFRSLKLSNETSLKIVPCSLIALVKKYSDAHGTMNDLDTLSKQDTYSSPLREIFLGIQKKTRHWHKSNFVPSILSNTQEKILASAAERTTTLVIGPPGTGKSYTIASLAMSYFHMGKSVLIVSGKDQAVDVIANKIEEQLEIKACIVRAGKKEYLKELKKFLQDLLNGLYTTNTVSEVYIESLEQDVRHLHNKQTRLIKTLTKRNKYEIKNGKLSTITSKNVWQALSFWFLNKVYSKRKPLWDLYSQFDDIQNLQIKKIKELIIDIHKLRLEHSLLNHRKLLKTFLNAIRARTGAKKENLFDEINLKTLLEIFPIWLVKLSDINRVLPLENELFDLLIIDEATQCDIASCLPALQRAKKVVITGDPKQLRHISFISQKKQLEFLKNNSLDDLDKFNYREKSILDFYSDNISDQKSVHFLNEHYRSLPKIISFSNEYFYSGKLNIMTEKPINYKENSVKVFHILGKRTKSGINQKEASEIINHIKKIVDNCSTEIKSIGILSPFRNQTDYLNKKINDSFNISTLEKHNILVGTAHAFQGEERDIMYISFVINDNTHFNVRRFIEKSDVFNVSITRAKSIQNIFYSFDNNRLAQKSILRKYIEYSKSKPHITHNDNSIIHDKFALEVSTVFKKSGFDTFVSHPVAGFMMDLIINKNNQSLGIDLIGYPGDFEEVYSLNRYKMFKRAGFTIFPLPYMRWKMDKDLCVEKIKSQFD